MGHELWLIPEQYPGSEDNNKQGGRWWGWKEQIISEAFRRQEGKQFKRMKECFLGRRNDLCKEQIRGEK